MKTALIALSIALLVLTACATNTMPSQETTPKPTAVAPEITSQAPQAEMAVNTIEQTSAQVDELSEEFDFAEFDQLDADLAAIDTLELG